MLDISKNNICFDILPFNTTMMIYVVQYLNIEFLSLNILLIIEIKYYNKIFEYPWDYIIETYDIIKRHLIQVKFYTSYNLLLW